MAHYTSRFGSNKHSSLVSASGYANYQNALTISVNLRNTQNLNLNYKAPITPPSLVDPISGRHAVDNIGILQIVAAERIPANHSDDWWVFVSLRLSVMCFFSLQMICTSKNYQFDYYFYCRFMFYGWETITSSVWNSTGVAVYNA